MEKVKLNLGSGDSPIKGYENIDRKTGKEVYPLDCEDGSIDELAPVVSRAVGDVSITRGPYLSTDAGSDYWNLTPYGREYVRLRKLVGIGGVAVV